MGFSSCLWSISIPMLLLALWAETLATQEYDDYSDETNTSDTLLCLQPRSFKGELNDTFLQISASTKDHLKSSITVVLIPSIYTVIFIVGLPANGLALWVLATKVKKMTSTVFFMNLAVADLLLILVLPFKIFYYYLGNNWIFGELMCRAMTSFFYGNMYCSALLLTSISVDRYLAVVHPFFSRTFRSTIFATGMCSVCWLIAMLSTIPLATMQQSYRLLDSDLILCHDALPEQEQAKYLFYYFMSVIVLCFILPLVIIVFSYIAVIRELILSGEKYTYAVKLSVLVLFIVIVFLTPSNVVLLMHYSEHCFERQNDLYAVYMVCLTVSTLNSCVDPFVYYYASEEFRGKVRNQFRKKSAISITSVKTSKETLPPRYSNCRSRSVL
ncbi:proteinase-activated receptor 4 [Hyla sarda]|uniref:proteinase-activated receptor 4 n=1 Tax=Hyla sarda TaxID=327740 RepID=UPI0024C28144|nr:proteinase-activated receptor 4 [Hyla sarda]XP_056408040.1 proteinase-activated receptor 4 [Hyla sarda]XP_056408041.1 proteinase-activated receptor 4 [Hyla sarda]XP_056408042.1 proteinase-activated receptor 4 [Hyla sarda]XP_056408043.1 proteinase-activated receptor 4 [Hyla sarda]XP_056408044.1 proteinase-activated receptor 4 [Hyla sarda]XP_056408045.1 proteinase-activated receptor 4 [Hyla sarda]